MKIYAGIAIAIIGLGYSTARAQNHSESHLKAAEDLVVQMKLEQTLEQSMEMMLQAIVRQNPSALGEFKDVIGQFLKTHMSWERMKPRYMTIYADAFTEQELKDIVNFYRTETGRKLTSLSPLLMRKGAELGEQILEEHLPELQKMIEERIKELENGAGK